MNEPTKSTTGVDSGDPSLPALFGRLGEDVIRLIDTKLSLLKIEIQEDLWGYGRTVVALLLAGIVAAIGFALVNVAAAFVVANLLQSTALDPAMQYAVGFAATGLAYLAAGTAIAIRSWHSLGKRHSAIVKTVAELEPKDKKIVSV